MPFLLLLLLLAPSFAGALDLPDGRILRLRAFTPAGHAEGLPARAQWRAANPGNYAYRLQRQCYCPRPLDTRVYVVHNRVVAAEDLKTGETITNPATLRAFHPIEGYFKLLDTNWQRQPAVFEVRHHRRYGFPERIFIDPAYNVADDEVEIHIGELRGLAISGT